MRPRTLLILLAIVLGLGTFIWFYERKLPSSEERIELGKKVFDLKKDDVTAVELSSPKGRVRLERVEAPAQEQEGGKDDKDEEEPSAEWHVVEPVAARADSFAVDRLLEAVVSLEKSRTLEDVDARAVGLDSPRATVRLTTRDGRKVLKLGAEVPTGSSLIAGLEGSRRAYVVSDTILSEVDKAPGDWRDRQMFHGDREAVQRISLISGARRAGGPRPRPQGFWIEKPQVDRADRELVDGLLSDLTGMTAERFLDAVPPGTDLGLSPPREVVEVTFQDNTPSLRVELGAPVTGDAAPEGQTSGELSYGRIGEALFEIRTRLAESARRPAADWRARQLSAFEVFQIESARVSDGAADFQLTRSGTDWKRKDAAETTISYLPVSDLLFTVTGAKADRLLAPAEAQAARPALTFALHTKDAGDETLMLYPELPQGVPARAVGRGTVLLLPPGTLRQIQEKLQAVRTARPVTPEK